MTAPSSDLALFDDDALDDPYPIHAELRELGPAVYLTRYDVWAYSHYDAVRAALADYHTYSSADGIAMNEPANANRPSMVLVQDPPVHAAFRGPLMANLRSRAVEGHRQPFSERADKLVRTWVQQGSFDAAQAVAHEYVVPLVADLIGLPDDHREHLLSGSKGQFDLFGPLSERAAGSMADAAAMMEYLPSLAEPGMLSPGSWGADLCNAMERGEITPDVLIGQLGAYTVPSMITTIHGITSLLWLLATYPDEWQRLRANHALVSEAFSEALRLESPIQTFSRRVNKDVAVGDAWVPEGAWAIMLYGAANRDDRKWGATADQFDIGRPDVGDHLAFGSGPHLCAGMSLARVLAEALMSRFVEHVDRIELESGPNRELNNLLRGLDSLPLRVRSSER